MRNERNHARHPFVLILAVTVLISGTTLFADSAGLAFAQGAGPGWSFTGHLNAARFRHTATLLPGGKVLVAGGLNTDTARVLASAELYDPATGTWSVTGSLNVPRYLSTATLLTNGKVLVAGGYNSISGSSPTINVRARGIHCARCTV